MPRQGNEEGRSGRGRPKKLNRGRTDVGETFARLLYFALKHLHLSQAEFWLMPFGLLMDLWECHMQEIGASKPRRETFIDEIIPPGI